MKKHTYTAPQTEIVCVRPASLLTNSTENIYHENYDENGEMENEDEKPDKNLWDNGDWWIAE